MSVYSLGMSTFYIFLQTGGLMYFTGKIFRQAEPMKYNHSRCDISSKCPKSRSKD